MGLDLYAGTLTRYYSGNWKTAVQTKFAFSIFWQAARFAEENDVAVVLDY